MAHKHDLTGQVFHFLTVLSYSHSINNRRPCWVCLCRCGNTVVVKADNLRQGGTKSCGCLKYGPKKKKKHGHTTKVEGHATPTYHTWVGMKSRCSNKKGRRYGDYGGRGITVCDRWMAFENFLADMGEKPEGCS